MKCGNKGVFGKWAKTVRLLYEMVKQNYCVYKFVNVVNDVLCLSACLYVEFTPKDGTVSLNVTWNGKTMLYVKPEVSGTYAA